MPYDSEGLLQRLLQKYPQVLAGEQINSQEPRRWLLVSREIGIPDHEDGGSRWALDHLFLDQDGVPTLVEVKRGNDTRIRREVVGQLLDYASNAVAFWPIVQLQSDFEKSCLSDEVDPNERLEEFLDGQIEANQFWDNVKTNLQAGKIRMVFVSDCLPQELVRIIEFLNSQMDPAEVLGVEIKQYVSEGLRTLVPKVVGNTSEARQKKSIKTKAEIKPELLNVLKAYEKYNLNNYELAGFGSNFKKVMIPNWPPKLHYEFMHTKRWGHSVELHIENDQFREVLGQLRDLIESTALPDGKRIEFEPTWKGNRGRFRIVLGQTDDNEKVAKAMNDFIEATSSKIAEIIAGV